MKIFEKIFEREELKNHPPILVDIGASGLLYPAWEKIAKYCVCVAFDPDSREMKHLRFGPSPYKALFIENLIVTPEEKTESDFYLTKSPFCSSILKPAIDKNWSISPLFEIEKKVIFRADNLKNILAARKIDRLDWFKTDSQGTDLAIFKSIGENLIRKTLVADFEPGIIDAYEGEDKTWEIMQFMEKQPFWMNSMKVMGTEKMPNAWAELPPNLTGSLRSGTADSPGWTEMSYLNDGSEKSFGVREYLLLWVFATIKNQHGFAFDLAVKGEKRFSDGIFSELRNETEKIAATIERRKRWTTRILRLTNRFKKSLKKLL